MLKYFRANWYEAATPNPPSLSTMGTLATLTPPLGPLYLIMVQQLNRQGAFSAQLQYYLWYFLFT